MSVEPEEPDPFERVVPALLKVEKPEIFWSRQKNAILARIRESRAPRPWFQTAAWAAAPFLAGFFGVVAVFRIVPGLGQKAPESPPVLVESMPPPQDWALLEQLEMMEHWESLKKKRA